MRSQNVQCLSALPARLPIMIQIPPSLMCRAISLLVPRYPISANSLRPRLVNDVMQTNHLLIAPHLRMPVTHGLDRVVLPSDSQPSFFEEMREEVLIGKHET